ncbi:MAG: LacI family DNA-binding transcriptional regulator, partial [Rubrobacteraceae bacterium]|nr:LacI family DNA-binding transcriptional regulator [Rubrobacteraceae bacterium]
MRDRDKYCSPLHPLSNCPPHALLDTNRYIYYRTNDCANDCGSGVRVKTMKDVAQRARVSVSTVSHVLNGTR